MSSKEHAYRLGHALVATGFAEPVSNTFRENQVTVIFRLTPGSEAKWVEIVKDILKAEQTNNGLAHSWKTDISKPYFMKDGKLVYGWRISIFSTEMSLSLDCVVKAMKGEIQPGPVQGEVTEMGFTGMESQADRNVPRPGSKKGAYIAETIPIDRR
jgi:hypothetical protein